jgi:hypothetical protein
MESRQHATAAAKVQPTTTTSSRENYGKPWPSQALRPLSDTRETPEPSLIDMVSHAKRLSEHAQNHRQYASNVLNAECNDSARSKEHAGQVHIRAVSVEQGSSSYSSTPEGSSCYVIPQSSVPRPSSSQAHTHATTRSHTRKPPIRSVPPEGQPARATTNIAAGLVARPSFTVPNHGASESPVNEVKASLDPVTSDTRHIVPPTTVVRPPPPVDILDFPTYRHPRLRLALQASAPFFVGGGSIEGTVKVVVDDNESVKNRRSLGMAAVSIDLLGRTTSAHLPVVSGVSRCYVVKPRCA